MKKLIGSNFYSIKDMSPDAIKKLPCILNQIGHTLYRIDTKNMLLEINANAKFISEVVQKAEELAHGEPGYLICVKKETYSSIWIPKTKVQTEEEAYNKAIEIIRNGEEKNINSQICFKLPVTEAWISEERLEEWNK